MKKIVALLFVAAQLGGCMGSAVREQPKPTYTSFKVRPAESGLGQPEASGKPAATRPVAPALRGPSGPAAAGRARP